MKGTKIAKQKGLFITFEGPEGSGKSTQSRLLYRYLKRKGYPVIYTREPGGTPIGERIRRLLLDPGYKNMEGLTELFLYMAGRAQLVREVILPALEEGEIVICDRFLDATVCYQGYGGRLDLRLIKSLGEYTTGGIKPDLTFLLDIKTEEGLARSKRHDRMESKSLSFHRRVRRGYSQLARREPRRIKKISADEPTPYIQHLVRREVLKILK